MHLPELFPHFFMLQRLVDGSLNQSQNLITAMRRWVLINWFYGEESRNLSCKVGFTFHEWSQEFFYQDLSQFPTSLQSGHPLGNLLEKNEEISQPHHQLCPCYKTTVDWLRFYHVNVDDWLQDLQQHIYISEATIHKVVRDKLFRKVRKTLQADLNSLIAKKCLKSQISSLNRQNLISRVEKLPSWLFHKIQVNNTPTANNFPQLNTRELANLAQALDMLGFIEPKLAAIAEQISGEVYGTRRVFLHVDYILPADMQENVDGWQEKLEENWQQPEIKPIFFNYASASRGAKKCLVYPVCIYYVQRAKYLCGYGLNPHGKVNWYNYRLERIRSLFFVDWHDKIIPKQLFHQYLHNQLPEPKDVEAQMQNAWGFAVDKPPQLMLLRFNSNYHHNYIKNTCRHHTFTQIQSPKQLTAIIRQYAQTPAEVKLLQTILQQHPNDPYYTVKYRDRDHDIIMRLLSWGANVEVLLPIQLRQQIAQTIHKSYRLYQSQI